MRIGCAVHCDAATVRDGLLHILGAGVTRVSHPSYPAPLGTALALQIVLTPEEARDRHVTEVRLVGPDDQVLFAGAAEFSAQDPDALRPDEEASAPITLPLQALPIPAAGRYSFEITINGEHAASIPFQAVQG